MGSAPSSDERAAQAAETVEMSADDLAALLGALDGDEAEDRAGDHDLCPMPVGWGSL